MIKMETSIPLCDIPFIRPILTRRAVKLISEASSNKIKPPSSTTGYLTSAENERVKEAISEWVYGKVGEMERKLLEGELNIEERETIKQMEAQGLDAQTFINNFEACVNAVENIVNENENDDQGESGREERKEEEKSNKVKRKRPQNQDGARIRKKKK